MFFYRSIETQQPVELVITPSTATINAGSSVFFSVQALNVPEGEGFTAIASIGNPGFSIDNPNLIFFGDPLTAGFTLSYSGFLDLTDTLVVSGSGVQLEIEIEGRGFPA
jgi:hypothetical protein